MTAPDRPIVPKETQAMRELRERMKRVRYNAEYWDSVIKPNLDKKSEEKS